MSAGTQCLQGPRVCQDPGLSCLLVWLIRTHLGVGSAENGGRGPEARLTGCATITGKAFQATLSRSLLAPARRWSPGRGPWGRAGEGREEGRGLVSSWYGASDLQGGKFWRAVS